MFTIRFSKDGDSLVREHKSFRHAKMDFLSVATYMTETDRFPAWRRVVLCEEYEASEEGITAPIKIKLEARRYD